MLKNTILPLTTHWWFFNLPDSLTAFNRTEVRAFRSFLFTLEGVVFVKALAKNKELSDLTDGFLLFRASKTSSRMASRFVYRKVMSSKLI